MSSYYVFKNLEYYGPFSVAELNEMSAAKRILPTDLVCEKTEKQWRRLQDLQNLNQKTRAKVLSYVALKQVSPAEYRTLGPFTPAEVKILIANKELKGIDYLWLEGWPEWRRIHTLEEFQPQQASDAVHHAFSPEDFIVLKPIELLLKNRWLFSESPPADACGEDLLGQSGVRPLVN